MADADARGQRSRPTGRETAEANRKKRRADLATEAVANPEKAAQRKVGKADRRKRKADETKAAVREGLVEKKVKKRKKKEDF